MDVPHRPLCKDPDTELFEPLKANIRSHDRLILETMTRTADRPFGRALILCPPGAAKTTNASIIWPSHRMGKHPGTRIALGSYGADLALTMGRRTRAMIRQPRYRAIFNTGLSRDSSAGDKFMLENGSEYMADSISGQFPGHRFDGAIADDPVKGISQAQSETKRATTWDEFRANFMTRIVPTGWLAIIMTRWSEEDPAGHILPEDWNGDSGMFIGRHDGLQWEVLCLQAKCETTTDPLGRQIGEYLAPEWFPPEHWAQYESNSRDWNSLFQQRPRPIEGAFFHEEDLLVDGKPIAMPEKVDYVFAVIDTAMKTGKAHDGLGVTFFARSKLNAANPPLAICDWDYTQINSALLIKWLPSVFIRLEELAKQTKAFGGVKGVCIEDKVSGTILLAQVMQMPDWKPEWRCTPIDNKLTALGKKERAMNVIGHVAAGKVKFTEHALTKTVTFKGSTRNHLRSQVLNVSMDSKDTDADDLLDCFTYSIALALGNSKGF